MGAKLPAPSVTAVERRYSIMAPANAFIDEYRSCGALAIALPQMKSSIGFNPGRNEDGGGASV